LSFAQRRRSAWKADSTNLLARRVGEGNFRSESGRFGHLTQAVLSI
jgi:hypothetical protein